MKSVKAPFFLRWFSPAWLVCDLPASGKVIYLTFDDGPIPEATPEILGILETYKVTATFFMVGDNVRRNPEIFEMVNKAGHAIGNHTYHHLNGWKTPPGAYIEDVARCEQYFQSGLFRPPYGRFNLSQYFLLRKKYRFVLWSVLTWDFDRRTTPEICLQYALDNTGEGSVVVFHDSVKSIENVRYALPRFLSHFLGQGYRFETIPTH